jgi:Tfp pilus assembly protein PilV
MALMAMICLLFVSLIGASLLRTALTERQQTRRAQWQLQAEWLVESGVERSAAMLSLDSAYAGETWMISPAELNGTQGGLVTIEIRPVSERPDSRLVSIIANYADGSPQQIRSSKTVLIDIDLSSG